MLDAWDSGEENGVANSKTREESVTALMVIQQTCSIQLAAAAEETLDM